MEASINLRLYNHSYFLKLREVSLDFSSTSQ